MFIWFGLIYLWWDQNLPSVQPSLPKQLHLTCCRASCQENENGPTRWIVCGKVARRKLLVSEKQWNFLSITDLHLELCQNKATWGTLVYQAHSKWRLQSTMQLFWVWFPTLGHSLHVISFYLLGTLLVMLWINKSHKCCKILKTKQKNIKETSFDKFDQVCDM